MTKKRIIVLGAGLSGLSAAWHLQERGMDCQVFEKEPGVGGLCRSKKIDGFTFDYDGHLLHFRHAYTFGLIKDLLGSNLSEHQRSSWIYLNGAYTRYPFQANLYGLRPEVIKECLLGLIEANKNGRHDKKESPTFLDWIYRTFGKGIAKYFMIPYNTKFWTLPPKELTCGWFSGFIPVPSLSQTIEGTIEENQREFGYNAHFWYPKNGSIAQVPLALASRIKNINTGCQVTRLDLDNKEVEIAPGRKEKFDYLISTVPLPELAFLTKKLPQKVRSLFGKLKWNSIFNLNLGIERREDSGRHWAYFPQRDISFFRVGFFHNFSSCLAPQNKSSLYAEVSYSKNKPIDKSTIVSRIKKDLKKVGILTGSDTVCAQDINDIKYGYPIYDKNYHVAREKILNFFNQCNVLSCGRYGSWRYLSIEDAILDGKRVADAFSRNT